MKYVHISSLSAGGFWLRIDKIGAISVYKFFMF